MIEFGPEILADPAAASTREWLETNGLGGYASSTVIGLNTRRYHGLLIASLRPPVERFVLLSKLEETLVVAVGEFGRSPRRGVSTSGNQNSDDGRDHWPYCYTALMAGAGIKRGIVYGKSDKTGSAPTENPVHPTDLLATVYHSVGISPETIVYNHLNQPRELVKGGVIGGIIG